MAKNHRKLPASARNRSEEDAVLAALEKTGRWVADKGREFLRQSKAAMEARVAFFELRKRLNINQQELAKRLGISARTISRYESEGAPITLSMLSKMVRLAKESGHPDYKGALSPYFFWNGECELATLIGSLRRSMASLKRKTGIDVHPHRFRDTFAVELLENGEDIRTVQLLLGHKSLRTTEKHYAHFVKATQDRLHAAVSKLDFSQREATHGQVIPFPVKD